MYLLSFAQTAFSFLYSVTLKLLLPFCDNFFFSTSFLEKTKKPCDNRNVKKINQIFETNKIVRKIKKQYTHLFKTIKSAIISRTKRTAIPNTTEMYTGKPEAESSFSIKTQNISCLNVFLWFNMKKKMQSKQAPRYRVTLN